MERELSGCQDGKGKWDDLWRRRNRLYVYRNVVMAAESFLGGLEGKSVLEVGCGRGATLLELAKRGGHVTGLDYSEEALAVCRRLEGRNGSTGRAIFVNGDARELPFPGASFDFVFSVGLIEHFQDPLPLLTEQCRVLRSSGYLLVQVPQKYSLYTVVKRIAIALGKWRYGGWETEFTERQLCDVVRRAALDPEYVYGYGSFALATIRHMIAPTLDFGMFWRDGTELEAIRAVKTKTALDICVVAKKSGTPSDSDWHNAENRI